MTALAGGLLLMPGPGPFASGDSGAGLQIVGFGQLGNQVEVRLFQAGDGVIRGRLILQVLIDGEVALVTLPFTVYGGQRVSIRWVSPAPVGQIHRVGIIVDDGTPY